MQASPPPPLAAVIDFFETISPERVAHIDLIYAPDAWFKDPFNEVRGIEAISAIFTAMFHQVDSPRFFIRHWVQQGDQAFLTWDFEFFLRRPGKEQALRIHGASRLVFDAQGRISLHRDYWDAAEELYEKIPWVGALMRWLKRRVAH